MEKRIKGLFANIVRFTPSGVGLGIMAHSIAEQEWVQAILLSIVTAGSTIWVSFSGKFIEEAGKEAEARGGGLAKWMFAMGDLAIISLGAEAAKLWRQLASEFEDKYYERLIYLCRNYETQGLDKEQVLELQRVFVPLKVSQRSLIQISPDLLQKLPGKISTQQEIGQLLVEMGKKDSTFKRIAILGVPGAGKTTLLRYLTLVYSNRQQRKALHRDAPKFVPVLIYLRDVKDDILDNSKLKLLDLIDKWVRHLQIIKPLQPPPDWFAHRLENNQCLILLDGLDEIADEQERQLVSEWVDIQMYEYSQIPFILTSRPLGYKNAKLQQPVTVLEVQPFTLTQVKQFIHNWYVETEIRTQGNKDDLGVREEALKESNDLFERIRENPPLTAMAVNPLLLTMIATVHRRGSALPGKRIELYKEICQVLLEKRQRAKRLHSTLTASQKQTVLQKLALELMQRKRRDFELAQIDSLIQQKLRLVAVDTFSSQDFLMEIREVSGLLIAKEEGIYEFAHLSFQEYLASVEIRKLNLQQVLIQVLQDADQLSWWAETIRLYAAQGDTSDIIQAAMQASTVDALALAFDCLEEGESVDPIVRQELEDLLEQGLKDR
ncbi:MAG: transcriptional regulator [Leptolyngbya sp.]|nr:MAG: transcriptional regulator [Leptolyngbya sp.]